MSLIQPEPPSNHFPARTSAEEISALKGLSIPSVTGGHTLASKRFLATHITAGPSRPSPTTTIVDISRLLQPQEEGEEEEESPTGYKSTSYARAPPTVALIPPSTVRGPVGPPIQLPPVLPFQLSLLLQEPLPLPQQHCPLEQHYGHLNYSQQPIPAEAPTPALLSFNPGPQEAPLLGSIEIPASNILAKRPASPITVGKPLGLLEKKSKWTSEEDELAIELRQSGKRWEEIANRLPGRSATSCRLRYQNYGEKSNEWSHQRKNKLAKFYNRSKQSMWEIVAEEMGLPWRAVEAVHWQMGPEELAQRAYLLESEPYISTGPGQTSPQTTKTNQALPPVSSSLGNIGFLPSQQRRRSRSRRQANSILGGDEDIDLGGEYGVDLDDYALGAAAGASARRVRDTSHEYENRFGMDKTHRTPQMKEGEQPTGSKCSRRGKSRPISKTQNASDKKEAVATFTVESSGEKELGDIPLAKKG